MKEKRWDELLVYKLEGARFDDHAGIELRDLGGLYHLHELILEIAKAEFRVRLGRERVLKGADDLVDMRIRAFEDGCVQARVFLRRNDSSEPTQPTLFALGESPAPLTLEEEFIESVHRAAASIEVALAAIQRGASLPSWMPSTTVSMLQKVIAPAREDERLTIRAVRQDNVESLFAQPERAQFVDPKPELPMVASTPPIEQTKSPDSERDRPFADSEIGAIAARSSLLPRAPLDPPSTTFNPLPTRPLAVERPAVPPVVDRELRSQIDARAEVDRREREAEAAQTFVRARVLEGEVRMVDLDGRFRLRLEDKSDVIVHMSKQHEREVTTSLHDHERVRLRVRGPAVHGVSGAIKTITAEKVAVVLPPDPAAWSEALFERLARDAPQELVALLQGNTLPSHQLTFAAEIAGRLMSTEMVVEPLLELLRHSSAVVREGAIYGLAHHLDVARVVEQLRSIETGDPSPGVRAAATGAIEARQ